ncbi:MAG TPA: histidine--tRNA ligase [Saprospiraceae bacterium]|nr:histidine--tRNA ligase [Saprospiraceae bacterium]
MSSKPSIPKGTRDFLPSQVIKRKYIFNTIENVFKTYGYLPIETPTMENLATLTGKYGEEGDRLLFKVLNNGDFLAGADKTALENLDSNKVISSISKRGLRYDLTVPFARFVVMNQNEINLPFKRYQIQQVWRADRPQRGRYQEFYQCDVDVVGSESLMYEAELVNIYAEVFRKLGIKVRILINNRKILEGIVEYCGCSDKFIEIVTILDKLDKVSVEEVQGDLLRKGISIDSIESIFSCLNITSDDCTDEICRDCGQRDLDNLMHEYPKYFYDACKVTCLLEKFKDSSEIGKKGCFEILSVLTYLENIESQFIPLDFSINLARGLNYYTGCIFEVKVDTVDYPGFRMGSIGGGGRYDNLTGVFGLNGVSGVGVSFGAERIYDVMEELNLFPEDVQKDIEVLFVALDEESHRYAFKQVAILRQAGISCDLYPEPTKMKKQMSYANARKVPFVAIIGETEREAGKVSLKNMVTGEQSDVEVSSLSSYFVSQ